MLEKSTNSSYIITALSIKGGPIGSTQTPTRMLHPIMIIAHTRTGIITSLLIMEQKKSLFGTKHRTTGTPYHTTGTLNQPFPPTRSRKKPLPIRTPTHYTIKHQSKPETHTLSPICQDKLQAPPLPHLNNLGEGRSNSQTITQTIGWNCRNSSSNASFSSQQNWTGTKPIQIKFPWSSHV